jgi:hypothetical protein
MTWGYSPPKTITNYEVQFQKSTDIQRELLLKAGTKFSAGRHDTAFYMKTKRNGDYTINTALIVPYDQQPNIQVKKVAECKNNIICIPSLNRNWAAHALFQLKELTPRTVGYEHIIIRQDGLKDWPETKIRTDKPVYIEARNNRLFQIDPLKKRVFDRKLKKQYKEFFASFAFEFKVLTKMKHFTHYINPNDVVAPKVIKIKSVTYKTTRWSLHQIRNAKGLLNPKWLHMKLTKYDRMQLAILTMFELTNNWYSNDTDQYIKHTAATADRLSEEIWKVFCAKAQGEEKLQRYLKIATYEEQE